jgi:hypothetical protein
VRLYLLMRWLLRLPLLPLLLLRPLRGRLRGSCRSLRALVRSVIRLCPLARLPARPHRLCPLARLLARALARLSALVPYPLRLPQLPRLLLRLLRCRLRGSGRSLRALLRLVIRLCPLARLLARALLRLLQLQLLKLLQRLLRLLLTRARLLARLRRRMDLPARFLTRLLVHPFQLCLLFQFLLLHLHILPARALLSARPLACLCLRLRVCFWLRCAVLGVFGHVLLKVSVRNAARDARCVSTRHGYR